MDSSPGKLPSAMTLLIVATFAMLVQQSLNYTCQLVVPILATNLAEDLAVDSALLGVFLFIVNINSTVGAMSCGGFILRYGGLRVSQFTMVTMALGLFIGSFGQLWLFPLAAFCLGISAVSTPASSHILSRFCPPRLAPTVFSIKQTGVPIGSVVAGLLVPYYLGVFGLYGAFLAVASMAFVTAFLLQPLRKFYDDDRQPGRSLSPADVGRTLRLVLGQRPLRELALAGFAFGGLQAIFAGFFVNYLENGIGRPLAEAGRIFAIASAVGIVTRILWGVICSQGVPPRLMLSLIGLTAAAAAVATGLYTPEWSTTAITAVAIVYSATAVSWHGVLLAETARLAPAGYAGPATGGIISCISFAMMSYPAVYGTILALTDSYTGGFLAAAVPATLVGLLLLRPLRDTDLAVGPEPAAVGEMPGQQ